MTKKADSTTTLLQTPAEWTSLTTDPLGTPSLLLFDSGDEIVAARSSDDTDGLSVQTTGQTVHVTPAYNRANVDEMLADEFGDSLTADARERLLDWYDEFAPVVEEEIYDVGFLATVVEDIAYVTLEDELLVEEIENATLLYDRSVTEAIASTVPDWWAVPEDKDQLATATFAGYIDIL